MDVFHYQLQGAHLNCNDVQIGTSSTPKRKDVSSFTLQSKPYNSVGIRGLNLKFSTARFLNSLAAAEEAHDLLNLVFLF